MILAVTGHRPDKLGGYSEEAEEQLVWFAQKMLLELKPDRVLTGMALGWDLAIAEACHLLEIPYIAYVPFLHQEDLWSEPAKERYRFLLSNAIGDIYFGDRYAKWLFQKRNMALVDDCDDLLALWNGTEQGGTYNCIKYALVKDRDIIYCWQNYLDYLKEQ